MYSNKGEKPSADLWPGALSIFILFIQLFEHVVPYVFNDELAGREKTD